MARQRQARGKQGGQLAAAGVSRDPPAWGRAQHPQQPDMLVHRSQDRLMEVARNTLSHHGAPQKLTCAQWSQEGTAKVVGI